MASDHAVELAGGLVAEPYAAKAGISPRGLGAIRAVVYSLFVMSWVLVEEETFSAQYTIYVRSRMWAALTLLLRFAFCELGLLYDASDEAHWEGRLTGRVARPVAHFVDLAEVSAPAALLFSGAAAAEMPHQVASWVPICFVTLDLHFSRQRVRTDNTAAALVPFATWAALYAAGVSRYFPGVLQWRALALAICGGVVATTVVSRAIGSRR